MSLERASVQLRALVDLLGLVGVVGGERDGHLVQLTGVREMRVFALVVLRHGCAVVGADIECRLQMR